MLFSQIIATLWFLGALAAAYVVNKGGELGHNPTGALTSLKRKFMGYVSSFNISLEKGQEFLELWDNNSQLLKKVLSENHEVFGKYQRLPNEPDAKRNSTELITSKGLLAEEHHVATADGYILMLVRIKSPNAKPKTGALPLFLLHGLLSSCDCFILNLRNESLGFILADLGYDVWLGNIRGNRYTTKHRTLQPTDNKFWRWSFDEMGKYDVPVMVNYVLSQTGHQKLDFIAHSQGATNLITSVIIHGQPLIKKINKFVAMAPAIVIGHSKGLLKALARFARIVQTFWNFVAAGDIFAHSGFMADFAEYFCYTAPHICTSALHLMIGPGVNHFNWTRVPTYISHAPAGTSTQNMVHWSQQCDDAGDRLMYYDYGSKLANLYHYGWFSPPEYDLSQFTVPTYAFFGDLDWLVTPPDRQTLIGMLPNLKSATIYPDYNHLDFVWGYNVTHTLYREIVEILEM